MEETERLKAKALKILHPIKEADPLQQYIIKPEAKAGRSKAGYKLPDYFLVYFLFDELLNYKDLGQFEKVAWSFPIDYNGKLFHIEFRKFGLGLFVKDIANDEKDAEEVVKKINGAVKSVTPFFDIVADRAILSSQLSVKNNSKDLYDSIIFSMFSINSKSNYI